MNVDAGINIVRKHEGALKFQAGEIGVIDRSISLRLRSVKRQHRAMVIALTEASNEASALSLLDRIMSDVAPRLEFESSADEALACSLRDQPHGTAADAAIAWCDGRQARVVFCSGYRLISIRDGEARRVMPRVPETIGLHNLQVQIGDWLIMAPPVTDAALPLGRIVGLTKHGGNANETCQVAAAEAARIDPLNHHSVAAFRFVRGESA